jgi:hypothetical protein
MSFLSFLGLVKEDVAKVPAVLENAFKVVEAELDTTVETIVDDVKAKITAEIAKHKKVFTQFVEIRNEAEAIIVNRLKAIAAYEAALAKLIEGEEVPATPAEPEVALPVAAVDQLVAAQVTEAPATPAEPVDANADQVV